MTIISRTKLNDFLNQTHGKIFTATFQKKDGTWRDMNCRKGVSQFLKGGVNHAIKPSNGLVVVFDMQKHEYRSLNLDTVQRVKFKGELFSIV